MSLIRWNPWNLDRMLDDDFEFPTIPGITKFMSQGLDLYETEDSLVAQAHVPGIPEDRIDITFENGIVRITGSVEQQKEESDKRRYFMSSMANSFNYSFRIPEGVVQSEEPVAELENGVLKLVFKKVEKKEPRKIKISAKATK
jgi:HSP20 family protein